MGTFAGWPLKMHLLAEKRDAKWLLFFERIVNVLIYLLDVGGEYH